MDEIVPFNPDSRSTFAGDLQKCVATSNPAEAAPEVDVDIAEETDENLAHPWRVILFNDDIHTFGEVITQLIKATACTSLRAEQLAWKVHTTGKACVFEGDFEECFRVQGILKEIALVTEIEG